MLTLDTFSNQRCSAAYIASGFLVKIVTSAMPMSDGLERAFSGSGCLITDRRNRLRDDIIERHDCLGSWERAKVITIAEDLTEALVESIGEDNVAEG